MQKNSNKRIRFKLKLLLYSLYMNEKNIDDIKDTSMSQIDEADAN